MRNRYHKKHCNYWLFSRRFRSCTGFTTVRTWNDDYAKVGGRRLSIKHLQLVLTAANLFSKFHSTNWTNGIALKHHKHPKESNRISFLSLH